MSNNEATMDNTENKDIKQEKPKEKESFGELAKTALIAIVLALLIRSLAFEPFNIPSGSMVPTLLVGDYLFISKYSYGYSRYSFPFGLGGFSGRIFEKSPERGDVIVFKLPTNRSVDYIKRLVGMPGDTIQVINGRLYINDTLVERESVGYKRYSSDGRSAVLVKEYIETLPGGRKHSIYEETDNGPFDNTEKFSVPEGHYFMMGDNRDNSRDSRATDFVGFVPADLLLGRAERIFFSVDGSAQFFEFWKWPFVIRYDRLFDAIR
ncbi:MAG: signal peptidase I [Alphaproteobacteria bacterium]|nr:signal peptidase I [Alphaproteobacteria bacterium]